MSLKLISSNKCFGGFQKVYQHESSELKCTMKFGVYLPEVAETGSKKLPVVYFLSGLTCTHENFIHKSGFQRYASENNLIVVNPDTSPRGVNIAGEDDSYDFGSGAGFYVDATVEPWSKHYRMFSYVTKELPQLVDSNFPVLLNSRGIFGHSMGGHGALICALKNPGFYKSVSAFAPISNPINCPWGQKILKGYFGEADQTLWRQHDSCELLEAYKGPKLDILVDQGAVDEFLASQLKPDHLLEAAKKCEHVSVNLRIQNGYDHSYYFVASFLGDHLKHHAKILHSA